MTSPEQRLGAPQEQPQNIPPIEDTLKRLENTEIRDLYEEARMPTFESLEIAARVAGNALFATGEPEAERIAKLLKGSTTSIKVWCRKYVASVLRFQRSRINLMHNKEEETDAFADSDSERRRLHDSLLNALSTLNQLLTQAQEQVSFEEPAYWDSNFLLPSNFAREHGAVFSDEAIRDRGLIRDWAIVADRLENAR